MSTLSRAASLAAAADRREGLLFLRATDDGTTTSTHLLRLKANGNVDAAFAGGGSALVGSTSSTTSFAYTAIALDRRRILVAYGLSTSVTVRRFSEDGDADAAFGTAGAVTLPLTNTYQIVDVMAQPDRKVLVATSSLDPGGLPGTSKITLYRLTEAGVLDASFGTGGVAYTAVPGSLDGTFGTVGIATVPFGTDRAYGRRLAIQRDGKPLSVGIRTHAMAGNTVGIVLRHTAFGTRDSAWDGDGIHELLAPGFPDSNLGSIGVDERERILVSGSVTNGTDTRWFVARLKPGPMVECR